MTATERLPAPHTESYEWQRHAACRGAGSAVFFAPEGERGAALHQRERHAKRICAQCPVQPVCRQHALTVGEPYGVWGGLTPNERAILRARIS